MPKIVEKAKQPETATNCQNRSAVFCAFLGLAGMPETAKTFAKKRLLPKGLVFSGLALFGIFAESESTNSLAMISLLLRV